MSLLVKLFLDYVCHQVFHTDLYYQILVLVVDACPASFHPAFMDGHKLVAVPGIHPPSYEGKTFL